MNNLCINAPTPSGRKDSRAYRPMKEVYKDQRVATQSGIVKATQRVVVRYFVEEGDWEEDNFACFNKWLETFFSDCIFNDHNKIQLGRPNLLHYAWYLGPNYGKRCNDA